MNKKIFAILGILAIVMIGCAFAEDSSDNAVTISDINFTIPEGFTEDLEEAVVNETETEDGQTYTVNGKVFEKDDQAIFLDVLEYEDNSTEIIKELGDETTINNITGYIAENGVISMFGYTQDGKVIYITTANCDKDIIEEVLS